jgi:2-polyprenyl-6-methoxyphenol hydroxylase-like FAD-dependent oxidoreductase
MTMTTSSRGRVLVSGASIAGPTLAYWLHHHGFAVTVVEKAGGVRGGGYPIDVRGTALGVVERMGLLPAVRAAHVDSRRLTFLGADGTPVATLGAEALTGGVEGRDVELPRGDLTGLLHDAVRDDVEFVFGDHLTALEEDDDGVDVTFAGGTRRRFDLVVGADGLHSGTRAFAFGPEEGFHRYLGYCFAGWTMPNEFGMSHEGALWSVPGRGAVIYAVGDAEQVHGFLSFTRDTPPFDAFRDPRAQRDLVAARYAGDDVWEVPRLVAAMREADDVFFDVVSQIRMPRWSTGRVGLVGDAAHAPSFLSGQGSSLALVGAYVLAGELAAAPTHQEGFDRYERRLRDFVAQNQALADDGRTVVVPRTAEDIAARDAALRHPEGLLGGEGRPEYTALELPDYDALVAP